MNLAKWALLLLTLSHMILAARSLEAAGRPAGYHQKQKQPSFGELESSNVQRVVVGRPVKFKCVVNDIGEHKVAWFHKDKRLLLAFDNSSVAWKERIQVSSLANSVFFLSIDSVQLSDKGQYSCQLNTQPAKSQSHILEVVKSPSIREAETTHSIEPVREFSSVELRCSADGIPKPSIKWRRESQMHLMPAIPRPEEGEEEAQEEPNAEESNLVEAPSERKRAKELLPGEPALQERPTNQTRSPTQRAPPPLAEGEVLKFERVTRRDMGFYICIASNDVPPSVSQRIFLPVSFVAPSSTTTTTTSRPEKATGGATLAPARAASSPPGRSGKNLPSVSSAGAPAGNGSSNGSRKPSSGRKQSSGFFTTPAERSQRKQLAASTQQAAAASAAGTQSLKPAKTTLAVYYCNLFLILYTLLQLRHPNMIQR